MGELRVDIRRHTKSNKEKGEKQQTKTIKTTTT